MDEKFVEITVDPEIIDSLQDIRELALKKAGMADEAGIDIRTVRRSIDARSRHPKYVLKIGIGPSHRPDKTSDPVFTPRTPGDHRVIIVGAGPAGYFAALKLLEAGIRPLVLERGKDVDARRKDIKSLFSDARVHPHSNYCFGEGGAGTFSDGKLYTRSTKRGDVNRIMDILVEHGASADIRIDAHPHVGSNALPRVVKRLRESICNAGGEIRFDAFVDDFLIRDGKIRGVRINGSETVDGDAVILATGHSARDIYRLLQEKGVRLEPKPFALGVRIEHPQPLIDRIFYHQSPRHPALPPAAYRISCQVDGRGVYSFCMCPGGHVIPASTAPGELVLNGMSMSGRSGPFANAGLVVEMQLSDIGNSEDPLMALHFQERIEKEVFSAGKTGDQRAPAQTAEDFVNGRVSKKLGNTSYIPGIYPAPLHTLLPAPVASRLKGGLRLFNKKYRGFAGPEATLLAVESRTSSPVRIIRDPLTLMHPDVDGLYPCGEGAGYAGGIVSAAMDGEHVAEGIARHFGLS